MFLHAVRAFHAAVLGRDETAQWQQLAVVQDTFADASADDLYAAASLLSDVLHAVPAGRDAEVAVVIGACVERGTDPATCAEPVLHRGQLALEAAAAACAGWTGPEPLPEPAGVADWEAAVVTVLATAYIRKALLPRPAFLDAARTVAAATGAARELVLTLALLDDEPLALVDRASGAGWQLAMSGIADNVQLRALLVERLDVAPFSLTLPDGRPLPLADLPADLPRARRQPAAGARPAPRRARAGRRAGAARHRGRAPPREAADPRRHRALGAVPPACGGPAAGPGRRGRRRPEALVEARLTPAPSNRHRACN